MHFLSEETTTVILNQILKGPKLPQVVLFHGYEGAAQMEFAKAFAKSLTLGNQEINFDNDTHPDIKILTLDEKGYHPIQAMKEMIEESYLPPYQGLKRVFIIDEAHKMQKNAASVLLKTLEEPAPATHFLLITTAISQILLTILSRSIKVSCRPLKELTIARYLTQIKQMSSSEAAIFASHSEGSLSCAERLVEDQNLVWRENLIELLSSFDKLSFDQVNLKLDLIEKDYEEKGAKFVDPLFEMILKFLRDVEVLRLGISSQKLFFKEYTEALLKGKEGIRHHYDHLEKIWREAYFAVSNHMKLKTSLEVLLLRIYQK